MDAPPVGAIIRARSGSEYEVGPYNFDLATGEGRYTLYAVNGPKGPLQGTISGLNLMLRDMGWKVIHYPPNCLCGSCREQFYSPYWDYLCEPCRERA